MPFDHVYWSPHLDDVALSCAGLVAAQRARGERVLVLTVCTGSPPENLELPPFVDEAYRKAGVRPADVMSVRLAEDRRAMEILDVELEWAGELDAIYRMPKRYDSFFSLCDQVAEGDPLFSRVLELVRNTAPGALVYAPLGIGRHVDHQIVHAAAAGSGRDVIFYEDFPYVANEAGALESRLAELGKSFFSEVVEISSTLERRIEAIEAYPSQVGLIGGGLRQKVYDYSQAVGQGVAVERFWRNGALTPARGQPE